MINGFACVNQDNATSIGNSTIIMSLDTTTSLATVFLYFGDEFLYLGLRQVGAEQVSAFLSVNQKNIRKTHYISER